METLNEIILQACQFCSSKELKTDHSSPGIVASMQPQIGHKRGMPSLKLLRSRCTGVGESETGEQEAVQCWKCERELEWPKPEQDKCQKSVSSVSSCSSAVPQTHSQLEDLHHKLSASNREWSQIIPKRQKAYLCLTDKN